MALFSEWAYRVKTHILNINNKTRIIFKFVIYDDGKNGCLSFEQL